MNGYAAAVLRLSINFMQLWLLVVNPAYGFDIDPSNPGWKAASLVNLHWFLASRGYTFYLVLLYIFIALLLFCFGLSVWVAHQFANNRTDQVWPVVFLRGFSFIFFQTFDVTSLTLLLAALNCMYFNVPEEMQFRNQIFPAKVAIVLYIGMAGASVVGQIDLNPMTRNVMGIMYTRTEGYSFIIKVIATIASATVNSTKYIGPGASSKLVKKFQDVRDVEILLRNTRVWLDEDTADPDAVKLGESIVKAGLHQLYGNPSMLILYSAYLIDIQGSYQSGYTQLQEAKKQSPGMLERFAIFYREQEHTQKAGGSTGKGAVDLVAFVEFQRSHRLVTRAHKEALVAVRAFWGLLLHTDVSYLKLTKALDRIETTVRAAERAYRSVLSRQRNSARLIRLYGRFLESVKFDPWAAAKWFTEAERLDEQEEQARDSMQQLGGNIDLGSKSIVEGVAVVFIDSQGSIQMASAEAYALLGFNKGELKGRDLGVILPPPFGEKHRALVRNYITTGVSHGILDHTNEFVAISKTRAVVPVRLKVTKVSGLSEDSVFMGTLEPLPSPPHTACAWLLGGGITATDGTGAAALGITLIAADDRFLDWLGYDTSELVGQAVGGLLEDAEVLNSAFKHLWSLYQNAAVSSGAAAVRKVVNRRTSLAGRYGSAMESAADGLMGLLGLPTTHTEPAGAVSPHAHTHGAASMAAMTPTAVIRLGWKHKYSGIVYFQTHLKIGAIGSVKHMTVTIEADWKVPVPRRQLVGRPGRPAAAAAEALPAAAAAAAPSKLMLVMDSKGKVMHVSAALAAALGRTQDSIRQGGFDMLLPEPHISLHGPWLGALAMPPGQAVAGGLDANTPAPPHSCRSGAVVSLCGFAEAEGAVTRPFRLQMQHRILPGRGLTRVHVVSMEQLSKKQAATHRRLKLTADMAGRITGAEDGPAELFGLEPQSLVGKALGELVDLFRVAEAAAGNAAPPLPLAGFSCTADAAGTAGATTAGGGVAGAAAASHGGGRESGVEEDLLSRVVSALGAAGRDAASRQTTKMLLALARKSSEAEGISWRVGVSLPPDPRAAADLAELARSLGPDDPAVLTASRLVGGKVVPAVMRVRLLRRRGSSSDSSSSDHEGHSSGTLERENSCGGSGGAEKGGSSRSPTATHPWTITWASDEASRPSVDDRRRRSSVGEVLPLVSNPLLLPARPPARPAPGLTVDSVIHAAGSTHTPDDKQQSSRPAGAVPPMDSAAASAAAAVNKDSDNTAGGSRSNKKLYVEVELWRADLLTGVVEVDEGGRVLRIDPTDDLGQAALVLGAAKAGLAGGNINSLLPLPQGGIKSLYSSGGGGGAAGAPLRGALKSRGKSREQRVSPPCVLAAQHLGDGCVFSLRLQAVKRSGPYGTYYLTLRPEEPAPTQPGFVAWLLEGDTSGLARRSELGIRGGSADAAAAADGQQGLVRRTASLLAGGSVTSALLALGAAARFGGGGPAAAAAGAAAGAVPLRLNASGMLGRAGSLTAAVPPQAAGRAATSLGFTVSVPATLLPAGSRGEASAHVLNNTTALAASVLRPQVSAGPFGATEEGYEAADAELLLGAKDAPALVTGAKPSKAVPKAAPTSKKEAKRNAVSSWVMSGGLQYVAAGGDSSGGAGVQAVLPAGGQPGPADNDDDSDADDGSSRSSGEGGDRLSSDEGAATAAAPVETDAEADARVRKGLMAAGGSGAMHGAWDDGEQQSRQRWGGGGGGGGGASGHGGSSASHAHTGAGDESAVEDEAGAHMTNYGAGKRFKKIYKLLMSPQALQPGRWLWLQALAVVAVLMVAHTVTFTVMTMRLSVQQDNVMDLSSMGDAATRVHEIALRCRTLGELFDYRMQQAALNITDPPPVIAGVPTFGDPHNKSVAEVIEQLEYAVQSLKVLQNGIYLGFSQGARMQTRHGLSAIWEQPNINITKYYNFNDETGKVRVSSGNSSAEADDVASVAVQMGLWDAGNLFVSQALEVTQNAVPLVERGVNIKAWSAYRFIVDNALDDIWPAYLDSMDAMVHILVEDGQQVYTLQLLMVCLEGGLALVGVVAYMWWSVQKFVDTRYALYSVFLQLPIGLTRTLANMSTALEEGDDDEDDVALEAGLAAPVSGGGGGGGGAGDDQGADGDGGGGAAATTKNMKRASAGRTLRIAAGADGGGGGGVAAVAASARGVSLAAKSAAAAADGDDRAGKGQQQQQRTGLLASFLGGLGGRSSKVLPAAPQQAAAQQPKKGKAKRRLVPSRRVVALLVLPFVLWGVIVVCVNVGGFAELSDNGSAIASMSVLHTVVIRLLRVLYFSLDLAASFGSSAGVLGGAKSRLRLELEDAQLEYNALLYGHQALVLGGVNNSRLARHLELAPEGLAFSGASKVTQVMFKMRGCMCELPEECQPPDSPYYEVTRNGVDVLAKAQFLAVESLLSQNPPSAAGGLNSTEFRFMWSTSETDLEGGVDALVNTYLEHVQHAYQSIRIEQVILFVIGWVWALLCVALVLRPFLRRSHYELRRIAELLSYLPPEVDAEGMVARVVVLGASPAETAPVTAGGPGFQPPRLAMSATNNKSMRF
ncbi:hypothetical protein HYH02_013184 [Chlamydomonas schloesseri]|uniref:PAS domain-containing protein n=1 Tax=Chlamydomonas schloesseri TaxID=2026947 RepID=A0A835VZU0_9CHLO|nr:hypothetical protein HYH02_013184 [Chlamydomonas schloesseri]|eukprot:KAG2431968.1 hypothetical protein HYH02_013184 [Chlamydomonas schloesseri]